MNVDATNVDVVVVGSGPTGLMLAGELALAGVRVLVLERREQTREVQKANGLGGQILELLRHRGLLERFEAASADPVHPAPVYPFGDVHVDFSPLADPPLRGLRLPQPRLERLLAERAVELGAQLRRGHEVTGLVQDDGGVTVAVGGPAGYEVRARYAVGCDGPRSRVRELAGIAFPGTTYPETQRLGQVVFPDPLTRHDNGDLEVPGLGRVVAGAFRRTEGGLFGFGWISADVALVSTTEDEDTGVVDAPVDLAEFGASVRRVLGADLPVQHAVRLSRWQFRAMQAQRYRDGRVFLAGDAAHVFPATGVGLNAGMTDAVNLAWKLAAAVRGHAPDGLLDTYHHERHHAGVRTMMHTQAQVALRRGHDEAAEALRSVLLELFRDEQPLQRIGALIAGADLRYPLPGADRHPLVGTFAPDLGPHADGGVAARPLLLDLVDRADLREVAHGWRDRVDVRTVPAADRPVGAPTGRPGTTADGPADALLIRPDAHVAWAGRPGEPAATAVPSLREALTTWFGEPTGG